MRVIGIREHAVLAREARARRVRWAPAVVPALAIIVAAALLREVPVPGLLPALSLFALVAAAIVAAYAALGASRQWAQAQRSWFVAGALAFAGFAAGMLSRPADVLHLFGVAPMN